MRMCVQLGGKGANLCEMARIGLNVPAGLTITTEVCRQYSTGMVASNRHMDGFSDGAS